MNQTQFTQPFSRQRLQNTTAIVFVAPQPRNMMVALMYVFVSQMNSSKSGPYRLEKDGRTVAGNAQQQPRARKGQGYHVNYNLVQSGQQEDSPNEPEISVQRGKKTTYAQELKDLAQKAMEEVFAEAKDLAAWEKANYPFPKRWQKGDKRPRPANAGQKRAEANAALRKLKSFKTAARSTTRTNSQLSTLLNQPAESLVWPDASDEFWDLDWVGDDELFEVHDARYGGENSQAFQRAKSKATQAFLEAPTWRDYEQFSSRRARAEGRAAKRTTWWDNLPKDEDLYGPYEPELPSLEDERSVLVEMGFDPDTYHLPSFGFDGFAYSLKEALVKFGLQEGFSNLELEVLLADVPSAQGEYQAYHFQAEEVEVEMAFRIFAEKYGVSL